MRTLIPKKPKSQKEQISMVWDALFNGIIHRVNFQDTKINFILGFMVLILGLLGFLAIAFMIGQ